MTNQQAVPETPRSTASDGKTELFSFPGRPLMVRAVDFNDLYAEKERLAALVAAQHADDVAVDALRLAAKSAAPYGTAMIGANHLNEAADTIDTLRAQLGEAQRDALDAARYRWLAAHCRSTAEHWGGRWSIVVEGPAPKSHDSEDDFDAAIDAAIEAARAAKAGEES